MATAHLTGSSNSSTCSTCSSCSTSDTPPSRLSIKSRLDFKKTVGLLTALLQDRGLVLFADIDQQAAAAASGLLLRPTRVFLFGNPAVGTPIMHSHPHAAIELPLRVVIWEDEWEQAHLDYLDPTAALREAHQVPEELLAPLGAVRRLLCAFAQAQ